ncbi:MULTISPECIES: PRD domain-containing protein [Mesobacillus]|uniref:PRD domain-containing protein n=2 Tax=Mesobacillus TaxID=2675231 RepID=A0A0D6ZC61_9BACI|nr:MULTISPECIES: PRD domain-containing protein [Mesobacillus]KIY23132.1 hypothetical protein UB32_04585 [Mesobacillus subterraneus]MDQ0415274.1 hemoglobin-like flavoprotein [Mesobacillus stamsii]
MKLEEYIERLRILLEQEVITTKSYEVALEAYNELLKVLNKTEVTQAEMLFTHLPMALTRINNEYIVEGPVKEIVDEIMNSKHFAIAKSQVDIIEENWGNVLPQGEKDFLYLHYTTVLDLNL